MQCTLCYALYAMGLSFHDFMLQSWPQFGRLLGGGGGGRPQRGDANQNLSIRILKGRLLWEATRRLRQRQRGLASLVYIL